MGRWHRYAKSGFKALPTDKRTSTTEFVAVLFSASLYLIEQVGSLASHVSESPSEQCQVFGRFDF